MRRSKSTAASQGEDLRQLARELFGEGLHGIGEQDGAAEGVQPFDIALALDGVESLALDPG